MNRPSDSDFMRRTLELASRGRTRVSPNPMVGAVLVKAGAIIAEAWHKGPGTAHAEAAAIQSAGKSARNATLYVNLEPCCHTGRTGPCTDVIIQAGIRRVVTPHHDPNPLVNGKGHRILRRAGIDVTTGLLRSECRRFNEKYLHFMKERRPFVTLKMAQTLDGRIAAESGDSKWISSEAARRWVHSLRAEHDAVVVGANTARRDDPELTVRHVTGSNPYRIIVAGQKALPHTLKLLTRNTDYRTIVALPTGKTLSAKGARARRLTSWELKADRSGQIDLNDFLDKAAEFGLTSLLVEGGSHLASSFVQAGLVDKYMFVIAPRLLGGGRSSFEGFSLQRIADAVPLAGVETFRLGPDIVVSGYPERRG